MVFTSEGTFLISRSSRHLQDCICEDTAAGGLDARGAVEKLGAHGSAAALTSLGPEATTRNVLNKVTFVNRVSVVSVRKCVNTT